MWFVANIFQYFSIIFDIILIFLCIFIAIFIINYHIYPLTTKYYPYIFVSIAPIYFSVILYALIIYYCYFIFLIYVFSITIQLYPITISYLTHICGSPSRSVPSCSYFIVYSILVSNFIFIKLISMTIFIVFAICVIVLGFILLMIDLNPLAIFRILFSRLFEAILSVFCSIFSHFTVVIVWIIFIVSISSVIGAVLTLIFRSTVFRAILMMRAINGNIIY